MKTELLADHPEAAATVAQWYYTQWGRRRPGRTADAVLEELKTYLNRDRVPLILLARDGGKVIGAAQLKRREMDMFPEREHWLGGVYVEPAYRRRGVATRLSVGIVDIARSLGVQVLHLQTERLDGGLYTHLGWIARERVVNHGTEVLVMDRRIA